MKLEFVRMGTLDYYLYIKTIPKNITNLALHYNAPYLKNNIPNHITYLEFEHWNQYDGATEIIPETVQYLQILHAQRFHVSSISHRKMTLHLPGHWE